VITSQLSIRIRRPLAEVYAYLMDVPNFVVWQSALMDVEASDGMNVGSAITFTALGLGQKLKLAAKVIENDNKSSFRVVSTRGPVEFDSLYTLRADGEDTIVWLKNKIDTNTVFRLAEPVLQSMSDSRYEADLAALKAILEA
jgi:hypothetical protein